MNTQRTIVIDGIDKLKSIEDALDKILALASLPLVEEEMTPLERKEFFVHWIEMRRLAVVLKNRKIDALLREWL